MYLKKDFLKLFVLILILVFAVANVSYIYADTKGYNNNSVNADALNKLGLFKGGSSGYELERAPTRLECSVMMLRLLGKEEEALEMHYTHPFTDVPQWGNDYVGYMYEKGLTQGIGNNLFGASALIDAKSYATFILRAIGYNDKIGDFTWQEALDKAVNVGILTEADHEQLDGKNFLRYDMVNMSYNSLKASIKNSDITLIKRLIADKAVDETAAAALELIDVASEGDNSSVDNIQKTKVTFFNYDGMWHQVKIDIESLPESMQKFTNIDVGGFPEASAAEVKLIEERAKDGKGYSSPYTEAGSKDGFGSYSDGTIIILYDDSKNILGYAWFNGKKDEGTIELEFKTLDYTFGMEKLENGISFNNSGLLLIDRDKINEKAKKFSKLLISNIKLEMDTPFASDMDIAANFEKTKRMYSSYLQEYTDAGFDYSIYKTAFNKQKCVLYLLDSNDNALGYCYFTDNQVDIMNKHMDLIFADYIDKYENEKGKINRIENGLTVFPLPADPSHLYVYIDEKKAPELLNSAYEYEIVDFDIVNASDNYLLYKKMQSQWHGRKYGYENGYEIDTFIQENLNERSIAFFIRDENDNLIGYYRILLGEINQNQ